MIPSNEPNKPSTIKDELRIVWIILETVKHVKFGKQNLSRFLKGSNSRLVHRVEQKTLFGSLYWLTLHTIDGYLDQLIRMELLKQHFVAPFRPVFTITDAGTKVLDEKIQMSLQQVPKKIYTITIGPTEKKTLALFREGKTVNEIAQLRTLATSTVSGHFIRLIKKDYLRIHEIVEKEKIEIIQNQLKKYDDVPSTQEVKEQLPENISYDDIRWVIADIKKE
ncbi:hypothetical protein CL622_06600 [archaeon]|nr:hypothetical protein [archaeon]|tara:strand:+ start:119 stop:784 length:666 start_codon:yes stop_codon:yes gene_type:complete